MKTVTLSTLVAAGAALVSVAHAQDAPTMPPLVMGSSTMPPLVSQPVKPPWDGDAWRHSHIEGFDSIAVRGTFQAGFSALRDHNFERAETLFARVARRFPKDDNAEASFYLGATRMELGKWEDAKTSLELAASEFPEHPDPKSRLGVTYAKLGNVAGAKFQRAELVKMAEACKGDCELSPYILGGIEMIDKALTEPESQG
jgi:TolA-binding protein